MVRELKVMSSTGAKYDFATEECLVSHCHSVAAHYLTRLEEWRPHIGDLDCTGEDAAIDALRQQCFLVIGRIGSSLNDDESFTGPLSPELVELVVIPLLGFLSEVRDYLWSHLEAWYGHDLEEEDALAVHLLGKEFTMAAEDIVITSLVINMLQYVRKSVISNSQDEGTPSQEAVVSTER